MTNATYSVDERGLFCRHCGRSHIRHHYLRGHGFICSRDRDASLAEDAKRLSGEAVAARAEGIAKDAPASPPDTDRGG